MGKSSIGIGKVTFEMEKQHCNWRSNIEIGKVTLERESSMRKAKVAQEGKSNLASGKLA